MDMQTTVSRRSLAEHCDVHKQQKPSAKQAKINLLNREPRFMYNLYDLNFEGVKQSAPI